MSEPSDVSGPSSVAEIRKVARELLNEALRVPDGAPPRIAGARELVNEQHVMAARDKGVLVVPPGAIVTPLARDAAERFSVELRYGASDPIERDAVPDPEAPEPAPRDAGGAVAIGSDHGGYKLKEALKRHLEKKGATVLDQGTTSDASCDYPDFAARVGKAVALGEARWGVFIDGAGIGGAMALNKMPGVFAATCHDPKAATNARGHNGANVLCLGSGWVDEAKALAVVDAFFGTGFEGGRHARRVAKIHALEKAFLR